MACRARLCYVNANLLVALDRRDPRALRFAGENAGCLYTVANVIEDEVPRARQVAGRHGIQVRTAPRSVIQAFAQAAARLQAALAREYTLSANDLKDIDHIAMAIATGARFFVTSEPKLCRWIEEYRDITGSLQCIDWRGGSCNGNTGRDKAGKTRSHEAKRRPRRAASQSRSPKGRGAKRKGRKGNSRLLHGQAKPRTGGKNTKKPGRERKRKVASKSSISRVDYRSGPVALAL